MNKIMQKLLEVTYPTINIQSLVEIVSATPNPEIATEMLCGLYVEPTINPQPKKGFRPNETNFTVLGYNKLTQEITYSYHAIPSCEYWVKNGEEAPDYGEKGLKYESGMYYSEDVAKKLGITKEEVSTNYKRITVYGTPVVEGRNNTTNIVNWQ